MLPGDAGDHGWLADRRVAREHRRRRKSWETVDATLHAGMWACLAGIALIAFLSGRL